MARQYPTGTRTARARHSKRSATVRTIPVPAMPTEAASDGQLGSETRIVAAITRRARSIKKQSASADAKPALNLPTAETRNDHVECEAHSSHVVARLVLLYRVRSRLLRYRNMFQNAMDANERLRTGNPKGKFKLKREPTPEDIAVAMFCEESLPLMAPTETRLKAIEKELASLASQLPVWTFIESIRGCGALGLALMIGATGDLSNYANPGKLWKRMGLALVGNERQRKCADVEKALAHGYNPRRRALMYMVGESLFMLNGEAGYYRQLCNARKAHTAITHPEWTPKHRHMDGLRYMEKRLLRHLWQVWKRQVWAATKPSLQIPADLDAEASVLLLPRICMSQHPDTSSQEVA